MIYSVKLMIYGRLCKKILLSMVPGRPGCGPGPGGACQVGWGRDPAGGGAPRFSRGGGPAGAGAFRVSRGEGPRRGKRRAPADTANMDSDYKISI